jgi:TonB family protein
MKKYFALAATVAAAFMIIRAQETPGLPVEAQATMRAAASQKSPELLDKAAAGYAKMHRYDVAQKLLENALAIRGDASGTTSAAYAQGLVKLGDLAAERRQFDEADTYYAQAIATGNYPEITPALLYMGIKSYRAQNYLAARGFLERILSLDPQGPKAGPALMWLGNVVQRSEPGFVKRALGLAGLDNGQQGDSQLADAEALYQRALALEDPKSFDAMDTMRNYASLLKRMGRLDESAAMEARAREAHPEMSPKTTTLPDGVYRVGGGITAPSLLSKVEPQYTQEARAGKIQGTSLLMVEIGPDGIARNITIRRSLEPGLDQKAIDAVTQWRFRPGTKDGVPVTVAATIEVNFRLQ